MNSSPDFFERVTAYVLGMLFGAAIGAVLAWLAGIFSGTLGVAFMEVSFASWMLAGAAFFGLLGAFFGVSVGTLVGRVIGWIFRFETLFDTGGWWAAMVLAVLGLVLWYGLRGA
jgi:hypothetical protein